MKSVLGWCTKMKIIVLVFAIIMILSFAEASATAIITRGGTIQEGHDIDLTCDEDGVNIISWDIDASTQLVHSVVIGDIDCYEGGNVDLYVVLKQDGVNLAVGCYHGVDVVEVEIILDVAVPGTSVNKLVAYLVTNIVI